MDTNLNGICPYFTMFPLEFPLSILRASAGRNEWVMDPFCGRGTTNYASRTLGLPSLGIDSSPVAVAISSAKLANTCPRRILKALCNVLDQVSEPQVMPDGEFWDWAFHRDVLRIICRLREGLKNDCRSDSRKALRAILLGALHGPRPKSFPAYLGNQSLRTYSPKPRYALRFWKEHNVKPERVNVIEIVKRRADRYYSNGEKKALGRIIQADSRDHRPYSRITQKVKWIITSPPYYGLRTYLPDQWLRLWFLGGKPCVDYSTTGQFGHSSPGEFALQLSQVWRNLSLVTAPGARLIVRFGAINGRACDPVDILRLSFQNTSWTIRRIRSAGSASRGRRQALHTGKTLKPPREEYDVWASMYN